MLFLFQWLISVFSFFFLNNASPKNFEISFKAFIEL